MSNRLVVPLLALTFASTASAASAASAAPGATGFATTYPHAARLCARAAVDTLPARLTPDAAQISTACTTLQASYGQAASTYATAVAPIPGEVQTVLASVRTARESGERSAVITARTQARSTLTTLRGEVRTDVQAYRTTIRGARATFWSTVSALPGARSLPTDGGPTSSPTAPVVPITG